MALDRKRSQRSPRISSSARNRGIDAHGVGGGNLATVPEHYQHQQLQYQHHQQQQQQQVDRRPPVTKCKTCCRKFLAFLVSNVGLCVLVVAYSVGGAFMFRAIEAPFEVQTAKQVTDLRNRTIRHLWNITYNHNVFNYSVWRQSVIQEIKYFQTDLLKAIKDGYEGQQDTGQEQWSFSGAFLFSLTVISTIGYGNISPRTERGKIVTILYAIFGIPLMLLYLTNIGDILAKAFRYVYGRLCSCKSSSSSSDSRGGGGHHQRSQSTKKRSPLFRYGLHRSISASVAAPSSLHQRMLGSPASASTSNSLPASPITAAAATANRPMHPLYHQMGDKYQTIDTSTGSASPLVGGDNTGAAAAGHQLYGQQYHQSDYTDMMGPPIGGGYGIGPSAFNFNIVEQPQQQQRTKESSSRVHVPITLCLILLTSYVCGGGVLFSLWEGWNFLDGAYFCFVTLSTIGFGDLVPGASVVGSDSSQEKLVICSLYLLAGMALLAMCFNLMQEEVIHKVRSCGQRLGIISDNKDDEDYGDDYDMS